MTVQSSYKDEWLDRAFRLAYFLHGDREVSKKIAMGAMNKLETASNAQFKRLYYTPTGRSESSKATRNRVSLSDVQLLQRLVFVESEEYEREMVTSGRAAEADLLRFFIKHLVRISLKRNSFYVTLAVSRILHGYATADAMELYNIVIQDPERVHDDYYYRSRKGVLMKELKARFGDLLQVVRVNRGEERFDRNMQAEKLFETAHESLRSFTPWNSSCSLPDSFDPLTDVIKPLHFDKNDPDEEHRTEVNRIHATLHPDCFERLTRALDLSSPIETMEIPKFMIADNRTNFDNNWNDPPSLDHDELQHIKAVLTAQAESRKAVTAGFLRIVVDGVPYAGLDAADVGRLELNTDAELVEIYAEDGTLLATHVLSFGELNAGEQSRTIVLEGGQEIKFNLVTASDEYGEVATVDLSISYKETSWQKRCASVWQGVVRAFTIPVVRPALTAGLILLALTAGWLIYRNLENRKDEIVAPRPESEDTSPGLSEPENKQFVANVTKPSDLDKQARQPELANTRTPRKVADHDLPKKRNQLKLPEGSVANSVLRDEVNEDGVLRLPIREPVDRYERRESREVRSPKRLIGISLAEVSQIYLEVSGDQVLGDQVVKQLAVEFTGSGNLSVTDDKEQADAALKLYVRHESDVDDPNEKTVAVIARLVNAKGFVIYPDRRGASAWKYVGTIRKLPKRLATDLIRARR